MGYSVDMHGHLCCDNCGDTSCEGTRVRRHRCPFGYCSSDILCARCAARPDVKVLINKQAHRTRGCEVGHLKFQAEKERERQLLESGQAVRCSALSTTFNSTYLIHVLFRQQTGDNIGFYMSKTTYHAIPLATPATPDDYRQFGELASAPSAFY